MIGVTKTVTPPVCLTIAGLDPSGGAGIVADIKTFSAFGCFAAVAVSSVTFQNTQGVFGAVHETADSVRGQIEPVLRDYVVAALKTGMLPTREIIETVAKILRENGLKNLVVDPVVRSTSGFDLIDDAALRAAIDELFPLATVITPNIQEAERIARMTIKSEGDIEKAAGIMYSSGAKNVLIKGGHFDDMSRETGKGGRTGQRIAKDYLFIDNQLFIYEADFVETYATHGTGCVLSSAITANLALGKELNEAVLAAKNFVTEAIRTAPKLGRGHSPINI